MKDIFHQDTNGLLKISIWEDQQITAGFTTRHNGVSIPPYDALNMALHVNDSIEDVIENRQKVSRWIERDLKDWKCINQVHSNKVIDLSTCEDELSFKHDLPSVDADGFITNNPKDVLVTFYADCVPIYFKSINNDWIGLAHAGWRGTVSGITLKMLENFKNKGISYDEVEIVIGPCISFECYEVDDSVVDKIPEQYKGQCLKPTSPGNYLLDLKRLNYQLLVDAGVEERNIHITHYCTFRNEDLFFSHRRDKGKTGRMMAFIYMNE